MKRSYWPSCAGFGPNSTPSVLRPGAAASGASATTAFTLRSIGRVFGIGAEGPSATLGEVGLAENTSAGGAFGAGA